MTGVLGETGGGSGCLKTVRKTARKFATTGAALYRLIVEGVLGEFLRSLQTRLRQNTS